MKTDERCPGETVCTTDKQVGRIASGLGRTLDNYCNAEKCSLFHTKPGTAPPLLDGALDAIAELSALRAVGEGGKYMPDLADLPHWALEVMKCSEYVRAVVMSDDTDDETEESNGRAGADALDEVRKIRERMQQRK